MKHRILIIFLTIVAATNATAQYTHIGEFGFTVGAAHYFGDLNHNGSINDPRVAVGGYYLKQFNEYLGMRVSAHFAQVGYSDAYSRNPYQEERNLSFKSNIWELAVHGDFNFFKFIPGDPHHSFTPFITLGVGVFTFNPYANIAGRDVYLQPLGTEGQNVGYEGRKPYSRVAMCFPIGMGIKYNLSNGVNFSFQVIQRLTTTDYLDDVSTTYAGPLSFPPGSDAEKLQDRSPGQTLGSVPGTQRGWSKQKDQYVIAEIGLSFNLSSSYQCPRGD
ncbi:MAG TPA: DUF6089 family protein [Ferruginibacter sp.]|jgi:hypothetical protein|nr:DUF6089 family protein [Ferruginibacter sp.]